MDGAVKQADQEALSREALFWWLLGLLALALALPDPSRPVHVKRVYVREAELDRDKFCAGRDRQRRRGDDNGEPAGLRIEPLRELDVERLAQRLWRLSRREDDGRRCDAEDDLFACFRSDRVRAREPPAKERLTAGEDELHVGRRNDGVGERQDAVVEGRWARDLARRDERLRLLLCLCSLGLLWDGRRLEARAGAGGEGELRGVGEMVTNGARERQGERELRGAGRAARRTSKGQRALKLPGLAMLAVKWVVPSARISVSRGEQCFAASSASFDVPASGSSANGSSAAYRAGAGSKEEGLTGSIPAIGDLDLAIDTDLAGADVAQPVGRDRELEQDDAAECVTVRPERSAWRRLELDGEDAGRERSHAIRGGRQGLVTEMRRKMVREVFGTS